ARPVQPATPRRFRLRRGGLVPRQARGIPRARDPVRTASAEGLAHRLSRRHPQDVPRPLSHPAERDARSLRAMSLVVTADDLGLSPAVTRGIIEAHRKGIVRSASLLVTFDASAEGAARAREWGVAPLAWDSHRHTHLMPPVAGVVGRIARDDGVRWIRRTRSPRSWTGPKEAALRAATLASGLAYRGIAGPTWYIDLSS